MTRRLKQYEVLSWASSFLKKHQCEERIGEYLLQHYLGLSRSAFYANMHEVIPPEIVQRLKKDLKAHVTTGIPLQHLTGMEYFFDRPFLVNKHVLIPRPETEELVNHVLHIIAQTYFDKPITIADIGTGSGVIGITLALHLPQATLYATDISTKALSVAKENANRLQAPVHFLHGDYLQPLIMKQQSVHIIVSNPPYVAPSEAQTLSKTVKHDPDIALFATEKGTAAYRIIVEQSKYVLKPSGIIAFEIGYKQAKIVRSIIKKVYPTSDVYVLKDINGKDRIVIAYIK